MRLPLKSILQQLNSKLALSFFLYLSVYVLFIFEETILLKSMLNKIIYIYIYMYIIYIEYIIFSHNNPNTE